MSEVIDRLIKAQLSRDGKQGGRGTIIPLHCAQMREYGSRGGHVQFDCPQDDDTNSRGFAINKWFKSNDLASKIDYIFDVFTCWGEVLWLLLPLNDNDYWVEFFQGGLNHKDPQFKIYYQDGGRDIESVVIRYSYPQPEILNTIGNDLVSNNIGQDRWVKLIINSESIVQIDCGSQPNLSKLYNAIGFGQKVKIQPNPFSPVLPIALSVNNPQQTGKQGTGDFHVLSELIERHESRLGWVDDNLETFGNPSLVTTRSAQEVTEVAQSNTPNTWAAGQGFRDGVGDGYSGSTSKSVPGRGGNGSMRIAKVIGNVGQDERFGYIQTSPISSDLTQYIRNDRELIHWCLGGVDPIGISSSPTFGEIKTLFGRVQNTADKKASALFSGLGKLFSIAIANEEQKFKAAFAIAMAECPKLAKQIPDITKLKDENYQQLYQMFRSGELASLGFNFSLVGLPPMGDRSVTWRHTREVYKPSTRDELDRSIVGRNLREDGLNQEFTMSRLYPELSPKEIQAASAGFSPRVVENQLTGLNSLLQFYQQAMSAPGTDPKVPLAIELGITQLIVDGFRSLAKELNYGKPVYTPADANTTPTNIAEFIAQSVGTNSGDNESATNGTTNRPESGTISIPSPGNSSHS